jgi:calcineurin-like phosphoesterase family protein
MTNIWVIADTHFGHKNILTFTRKDGSLIRGAVFKSIEQHDEILINNWNSLVRPQDHVYHLGDVVINRHFLGLVKRLNGHKRLVRGNHDVARTKEFLEVGFSEIYGVRVWPKHHLIFSHVPLHPDSLSSRGWINIHGHLHENLVRDSNGHIDDRYRCVSVEHTDYKPLLVME